MQTIGQGKQMCVTGTLQDQAWVNYRELLAEDGSPLLDNDDVMRQVEQQLRNVVTAVAAPGPQPADGAGWANPLALSTTIGRTRAKSGAHPAASLRAAAFIFQACHPLLAEHYRNSGVPQPESQAALNLNRAIMERMATAATSYVDYLLSKQQSTSHDERRRLSRELHDAAGHELVVALQSIELYLVRADLPIDGAGGALHRARLALDRLTAVLRNLSSGLRLDAGAVGLCGALHHFAVTLPASVQAVIDVDPAAGRLSPSYTEEIFLLLREAARNAVAHSSCDTVTITVTIEEDFLTGVVTDDGSGFDLSAVSGPHFGLVSMRERAEVLGGSLSIDSAPGSGTSVRLRIRSPFLVMAPSGDDDG